MATKHMVIDKNGVVHKRVSRDRVYSHAVVAHIPAIPPSERWPQGWPVRTEVQWASRRDLAEKAARRYKISDVEILVANHM